MTSHRNDRSEYDRLVALMRSNPHAPKAALTREERDRYDRLVRRFGPRPQATDAFRRAGLA